MMKPKNVAYAVRKLAGDHGLDGGGASAWIATIPAEEWHRRGASNEVLVDLVANELARLAREPPCPS